MPFRRPGFFICLTLVLKFQLHYISIVMIKPLMLIFALVFFSSCSSNQEERLSKLDKVYGYCDNPHRGISGRDYEVCKDKERAAGPDGIVGESSDILSIFSGLGGSQNATFINSDTNNFLWDGALQVLNPYSFKITDFDGGYIETDWILQSNLPNQRCLIKSHITSADLVSNGVSVKIICEELIEGVWYSSNQNLHEEEKQLTLKILNQANILSNNSNS